MKAYLLIIVLSFFQISLFSQQIEFFNVGWKDKYLYNLIINRLDGDSADTKLGSCYKCISLNEEGFSLIENYVVSRNTQQRPVKNSYHKDENYSFGDYPYGTFAILLTNKQKDTIVFYCLENGKKTAKYFEDMIFLLNKNEGIGVATYIDYIIFSRIDFLLESPDKYFLKEVNRKYCFCSVLKLISCVLIFSNIICLILLWRGSRKYKYRE